MWQHQQCIQNIWVVDETVLPRGLCRGCSEDTMTAFHFRQLCLQSKFQWEKATACLTNVQDPADTDKTLYVFYGDEISILTDQINIASNPEDALNKLNTKVREPQVERKPARKSKRIFELINCMCPDCGKNFNNPEFLNYHLRSSLKSACRKCGSVVPKNSLHRHLLETHGITVISCCVCNAVFNEQNDFEQHWASSHGPNTHSCCYCGAGFNNSRALRAHMYSHTLFYCKSCNNSFNNRQCFKYHQKQCKIKEEPVQSVFICDYCKIEYNKKPSLKVHIIQKHLNVLPFTCQECGKRASTLGHLKSHQKIHTQQRKIFQCYCGAKMRTELGYQLHQRIHTGERPYECNACGDRFLSASRRLDHMKRRHRGTTEMPHACSKCSARFIRPWELKKHYSSVHFDVMDVPKKTNDGPIRRRFKMKFIREESLCPKGACVNCVSAALAAGEFRVFVQSSQKVWTKAVNGLNALPFTISSPMKSLCAFIHPNDMIIQTVKDYASDPKSILDRLRAVVTKKPLKRKLRSDRAGPSCTCPDCEKIFPSPHYLAMHLMNSGQKEACVICGAVVLRGKKMKDHMKLVHNTDVLLCNDCPLLFPEETHLAEHVAKCHRPGAFTCPDCGRSFPRKVTFDHHAQMHMVRTCRACGSQFTNRGCYREHRSQCEPDAKPDVTMLPRNRRSNIRDLANYTCDYCGKTYTSRPQLKNHILWIHMDVRPHECQWCRKRFYTPARLAEHTVVHTRARNFECDICGAKLVTKMAAVYHKRRHTGEKPYKCDDCDECFISSSRRSEHAKRKHNKGIKLHCTQCSASFVRKHELKKHMDRAHSIQGLFYITEI